MDEEDKIYVDDFKNLFQGNNYFIGTLGKNLIRYFIVTNSQGIVDTSIAILINEEEAKQIIESNGNEEIFRNILRKNEIKQIKIWPSKKKNLANENSEKEENKEDIESKEILEELEKYVKRYNELNPNRTINIDKVHINEIVKELGSIGCYKNDKSWIKYYVGDNNKVMVNGPYSKDGIIKALATTMYIPTELIDKNFTDEEFETYTKGEVPIEEFSLSKENTK